MKRHFSIFIILLAFLAISKTSQAQGFSPPADTNAVVYFVRVTPFFEGRQITFFHDSSFVGKISGANYMRYECPAGDNLFWASTENKNFLDCELKAGGTYIVLLNQSMSGLDLEPIMPDNADFNRIFSLINSKKSMNMSPETIDEIQTQFVKRNYIARNLKKYKKKWSNSSFTKTITPDMAIPPFYLK